MVSSYLKQKCLSSHLDCVPYLISKANWSKVQKVPHSQSYFCFHPIILLWLQQQEKGWQASTGEQSVHSHAVSAVETFSVSMMPHVIADYKRWCNWTVCHASVGVLWAVLKDGFECGSAVWSFYVVTICWSNNEIKVLTLLIDSTKDSMFTVDWCEPLFSSGNRESVNLFS